MTPIGLWSICEELVRLPHADAREIYNCAIIAEKEKQAGRAAARITQIRRLPGNWQQAEIRMTFCN